MVVVAHVGRRGVYKRKGGERYVVLPPRSVGCRMRVKQVCVISRQVCWGGGTPTYKYNLPEKGVEDEQRQRVEHSQFQAVSLREPMILFVPVRQNQGADARPCWGWLGPARAPGTPLSAVNGIARRRLACMHPLLGWTFGPTGSLSEARGAAW